MRKKQSADLPADIEAIMRIVRNCGRPLPRQQIADYLADAHAFLKSSRQRALYDPADVAALAREVEAFESSLATGDVYLVACRALELGEFRFRPSATQAITRARNLKRFAEEENAIQAHLADSKAIERFRRWCDGRRTPLPANKLEQVRIYTRVWRLSAREKRRIRALASAGKL